MYRLKTVFSGIFRHRRRNIISCLLLTAVLSVGFCGYFYRNYGREECEVVADRYENRYRIAFRNELQYNPEFPHWSALDVRVNGTSTTGGVPDIYFDAEAMAAYNHPYPATTEYFESLGRLPECQNYTLAYAETAYGFSDEVPSRIQEMLDGIYAILEDYVPPSRIVTQHIVVGGDLDAFTGVAREITSRRLFDFFLVDGAEPGPGECVITDFYSEVYGKGIGDSITLCDITGEPVTSLKISGIYRVYDTDFYEFVNPDVPRSGRLLTGADVYYDYRGAPDCGTPFNRLCEEPEEEAYSLTHHIGTYYRVTEAMLGLIHTDYETAYTLYGTPETDESFEDRHHINNFFAYYNLNDGEEAAFEEEVHRILPENYSDEFTVYQFANSYQTFLRIPEDLSATGNAMAQITAVLAFIIFFIVTAVLVHENGRKIGIYLSLGVSERDIRLKTAGENTVLMVVSLLAAAFSSIFVHRFLSKGYTYLEMNEVQYGLTVDGLIFALCAIAVSFLLTFLYTWLYIRIHSPIRLIRQNNS